MGRELSVVARRWRTRLDERLRSLEMSQARWAVLNAIRHASQGLSQKALAEQAGIEPATLVRMIDALEAQGLVERCASQDDRRINLISLRPAALPLIEQMDEIDAALSRELLQDYEGEDLRALVELLRSLRSKLEQA
ncbi:MarR family winged helix-turn-helix transcriptional regulator [Phenylobacterium kunshanense]|uniref:MarR family winged helix-turn-helix transcriptional regulator n=1 Tax=Phenylobacterium kunshanense TaxID=1445034 RepID=UPI001403ABB9|nr:MarR family transcriptional regulator [Phenylobacterium kunshanense]